MTVKIQHSKLTAPSGHITLQELCQQWRPNDEETFKKLEARFKEAEVTGDQKLSLAGKNNSVLSSDRNSNLMNRIFHHRLSWR